MGSLWDDDMNITINKIKREIRKAKKAVARYSEKLGQHGFSYNDKKPDQGHAAYAWVRAIDSEYEKIYKLEGMIPVAQRTTSKVVKAPLPKRRAPQIKVDGFYDSREWRELRYQALAMNNGQCECCGAGKHDGTQLHVDHIKPRSIYPDLELEITNLQILCRDCNLGKSNKDDRDWRGNTKDELDSVIESCIAFILYKPDIVLLADGLCLDEICHISERKYGHLLFDMIYIIRENPYTTVAMLMGHFYGTKNGELLSGIYGRLSRQILKPINPEANFALAMSVLRRAPISRDLRELVTSIKTNGYDRASSEDINRLRELISESKSLKHEN